MPKTTKTVRLNGSSGGVNRTRQGRSRRSSGTKTGCTGSSDRISIKPGGAGSEGGGDGRGGKRGVESTVSLRGRGDGGGNQGRGKMGGRTANPVTSGASKGDENHRSGGGGGGGSVGSVDGRSRRDHGLREADGSNDCSKPTSSGANSGESVVLGKTAKTPPRNQRPKPPDAKDFTRWVMGRGFWDGFVELAAES